MENLEQDHLEELDLHIDNDVRQKLYETAKWSKFISIVMFVACGFMLLFGVLGGTAFLSIFKNMSSDYAFMNEIGGAVIIVVVLIIVAVIGLVYYFLFNFSQKIKAALVSDNTEDLNAGLRSLKIFFIISTVIAIISLLNNIFNLFN